MRVDQNDQQVAVWLVLKSALRWLFCPALFIFGAVRVLCAPQLHPPETIATALANCDSEDIEDLIAELEKDEAFTMEVRMRFEETVAALQKGAASEG